MKSIYKIFLVVFVSFDLFLMTDLEEDTRKFADVRDIKNTRGYREILLLFYRRLLALNKYPHFSETATYGADDYYHLDC